MRVMLMHRTNAANEAGIRPSPGLIAAVGRMIGELSSAGIFRAGEGLRASALGARIVRAGGRTTVAPGPFEGRNELPAALCVLRLRSLDEAVALASRLTEPLGDVEVDVRPVTEAWDLGLAEPPPGDPPRRWMAVLKADGCSEAGAWPAPEVRAALVRLVEEARRAGTFLSGEVLQPSARAARLTARGGAVHVVDGPFAETKELIAGYVTLEVPTVAAALPWARRYAACLGDVELDVRPLLEPRELG